MGTSSSAQAEEWCPAPLISSSSPSSSSSSTPANGEAEQQRRILCLHGWRTSGDILSFQMGALQAHVTSANYVFLDAPYPARGDPDPGIALFYADRPYYEWFYRNDDGNGGSGVSDATITYEGLEDSVQRLLGYIDTHGPFDGLLGFSQGASMVTRVLKIQQQTRAAGARCCRFAILIGGVPPGEAAAAAGPPIAVPSLHIMGEADPFLPESRKLQAMYAVGTRTSLTHQETHNIPSLRTNLYPEINRWIASK